MDHQSERYTKVPADAIKSTHLLTKEIIQLFVDWKSKLQYGPPAIRMNRSRLNSSDSASGQH